MWWVRVSWHCLHACNHVWIGSLKGLRGGLRLSGDYKGWTENHTIFVHFVIEGNITKWKGVGHEVPCERGTLDSPHFKLKPLSWFCSIYMQSKGNLLCYLLGSDWNLTRISIHQASFFKRRKRSMTSLQLSVSGLSSIIGLCIHFAKHVIAAKVHTLLLCCHYWKSFLSIHNGNATTSNSVGDLKAVLSMAIHGKFRHTVELHGSSFSKMHGTTQNRGCWWCSVEGHDEYCIDRPVRC